MPHAVEVHLRIRVRGDQRAAFLEFLREAIPFYERPGGIRVTLWEEPANPGRFIERIEYATRADYETDDRRVRNDPRMKRFLERWRGLLDGPPEVEVFERVSV